MGAIVQYWHAKEIPADVEAAIATVASHNPDLRHLVFDEESAAEFIAEHFTAREVSAFRSCAVPAMQADYLRYCAVLHHGGAWIDVDLRCIAPLRPLIERPGTGVLFGWAELPPRWQTPYFEGRERIGAFRVIQNNVFAFAQAAHPLLELILSLTTTNIENRVVEEVGTCTGPGVFTCLYLLRELGSFEAFEEYAADGVFEAFTPLLREAIGDYARVRRAFEGVDVLPMSESHGWVRAVRPPPAYKRAAHWTEVKSSIFR